MGLRVPLKFHLGERLPVVIADDEAPPIQLGVGLFDGPGRREVAVGLFYCQDKNGLTELGGGARRNMLRLLCLRLFRRGGHCACRGRFLLLFLLRRRRGRLLIRLLGLSI